MRLDCIGNEIFLHFVEKIMGPTVLFVHFLILFIGHTVLFQLTFTFIHSTFDNKFSVSVK